MGDLDDTLKPEWLYGVASGPTLKDVHHLKQLMKELNFAAHYGAGASKLAAIEDQIQTYSEADIQAVKEMFEKQLFPGAPAKPPTLIGHLFLGGPLDGKRIKTNGMWHYQHPMPVKPGLHGLWEKDEYGLPTVGYHYVSYVMQKIALPNGKAAHVYVEESKAHEMGMGKKDKLLGDYLFALLNEFENEVNTPVKPPLPEPIPAPPVPVSDGLRITIGGKTIEWTPDENQLAGLLSWAAQSLGPGKDTAA